MRLADWRTRGTGVFPLRVGGHHKWAAGDSDGTGPDENKSLWEAPGLLGTVVKGRKTGKGELGEFVEDQHWRGDIIGQQFIQGNTRDLGSWRTVWPAKTIADPARNPTPYGDNFGTQGLTTQGWDPVTCVVPIKKADKSGAYIGPNAVPGTAKLEEDFRYFNVYVPLPAEDPSFRDWPEFPVGWYGLTLPADWEDEQQELFMPTDPRMVAMQSPASSPMKGSLVVDLVHTPGATSSVTGDAYAKDKVDRERTARLQSKDWVIMRPRSPWVNFPDWADPVGFKQNSIAWNIGKSNNGDCRGGLIIDADSAGLGNFGYIMTGGGGGVSPSPNSSFSNSVWAGFEAAPTGDIPIGLVSQRQSGPLEIPCNQHELGQDDDGHPIYSTHISLNTLFTFPQGICDGPLKHDGIYDPTGITEAPERTYVFFQYDEKMDHDWVGGVKKGKQRWWAQTNKYTPACSMDSYGAQNSDSAPTMTSKSPLGTMLPNYYGEDWEGFNGGGGGSGAQPSGGFWGRFGLQGDNIDSGKNPATGPNEGVGEGGDDYTPPKYLDNPLYEPTTPGNTGEGTKGAVNTGGAHGSPPVIMGPKEYEWWFGSPPPTGPNGGQGGGIDLGDLPDNDEGKDYLGAVRKRVRLPQTGKKKPGKTPPKEEKKKPKKDPGGKKKDGGGGGDCGGSNNFANAVGPYNVGDGKGFDTFQVSSTDEGGSGYIFRPQMFQKRMIDWRKWMKPNSNYRAETVDRFTPIVGRLESFGAQGASHNDSDKVLDMATEWEYTNKPNTYRFLGGTSNGGICVLNPEIDLADIDNNLTPLVSNASQSTTHFISTRGTRFATGLPDLFHGGVLRGYSFFDDDTAGIGGLTFATNNRSVKTDRIYFTPGGNIGIVAVPADEQRIRAKLDQNQASLITIENTDTGNNASAVLEARTMGAITQEYGRVQSFSSNHSLWPSEAHLTSDCANGVRIVTEVDAPIVFGTNGGAEDGRFDSTSGFFGLNEPSPAMRLHITSTSIAASGSRVESQSSSSAAKAVTQTMNNTGTVCEMSTVSSAWPVASIPGGRGAQVITDSRSFYIVNSHGAGNLMFATGGTATGTAGNERMRITNQGDVGIKEASPSSLLHIHDDTISTEMSQVNVVTIESDLNRVGDASSILFMANSVNRGRVNSEISGVTTGDLVFDTKDTLAYRRHLVLEGATGNFGINGESFAGAEGAIFLGERALSPTGNPVGGGIMYVRSGALWYRGPGGTDTMIAAS